MNLRVIVSALLATLALASVAEAKLIVVTTTTDSMFGAPAGTCSLRDAVRAANADAPRGGCSPGDADDVIVLPAGVITFGVPGVGELQAATGDLNVQNDPLTVIGNAAGTVIDGSGLDRIFFAQQPLTLRDLSLVNGLARRDDPSTMNGEPDYGGAVIAFAGLTLEHVRLERNRTDPAAGSGSGFGRTAGPGGAVFAVGTQPVTITDSVFRDNSTGDGAPAPAGGNGGGGGYGGALVADAPSIVIQRTTFAGNRTGKGGDGAGSGQEAGAGGYYSAAALSGASVTVEDVVVTANVSGASGAGPNSTEGRGSLGAFGTTTVLRHLTVAGNVARDADTAEGVVTEAPRNVTVSASILTGAGAVCMGPFTDGGGNVTTGGSGCPGAAGDPDLDPDLIPAADGPAVDAVATNCDGTDARGVPRPQGGACDSGAIERRPSAITLTPSALAFGPFAPGALSPVTMVGLQYAGDGSVRLGALTTTGDFTATGCAGLTLRTAGTCEMAVSFRPTALGPRSGTLSLATPIGVRRVALSGGTGTTTALARPSGTSALSRARVLGARLVRGGAVLRLRVRLACPAGPGCVEKLRLRVSRAGVPGLLVTRRVRLAGGTRRTVVVPLRKRFAALDRRTALGVRIRLVSPGDPVIERTLLRRIP